MKKVFASYLNDKFDLQELKQINAFYTSPTGAKVLNTIPELFSRMIQTDNSSAQRLFIEASVAEISKNMTFTNGHLSMRSFIVSAVTLLFCNSCLATSRTVTKVDLPRLELATIVDFGIYSAPGQVSIPDSSSATGDIGAPETVYLIKQTDRIPARLRTSFGFSFSVRSEVRSTTGIFTFLYIFPRKMLSVSGDASDHYATSFPSLALKLQNPAILYEFTEKYELLTGTWKFQVWADDRLLLEKSFSVTSVSD